MRSLASLAIAVIGLSACGSGENVSRASWRVVEAPSGVEFEIVVPTGSSSCNWLDRVEVDESAGEVEVRAYVGFTGDDVCTADMNTETVTVTLDEALMDRNLVGCDPNGPINAPTDDGGTVPAAVDCRTPGR